MLFTGRTETSWVTMRYRKKRHSFSQVKVFFLKIKERDNERLRSKKKPGIMKELKQWGCASRESRYKNSVKRGSSLRYRRPNDAVPHKTRCRVCLLFFF